MDKIFPGPNLEFLFQVEVATEGSGSGLSEPLIEEPGKAEKYLLFKNDALDIFLYLRWSWLYFFETLLPEMSTSQTQPLVGRGADWTLSAHL